LPSLFRRSHDSSRTGLRMTPLQLAVWALLMGLSRHFTDADESYAERAGRLAVVAVAIVDATGGDIGRAARVVALGQAESNFARYVTEGRCQDGPVGSRCDPNRHGEPQSLGPWQQRRCSCPRAWDAPMGSVEQLRASARCADRILREAHRRCQRRVADPEAGAFGGYRGVDCAWQGGVRRAEMSRRYRARLQRLLASR